MERRENNIENDDCRPGFFLCTFVQCCVSQVTVKEVIDCQVSIIDRLKFDYDFDGPSL